MNNKRKLDRATELAHMLDAAIHVMNESADSGSILSGDVMCWYCTMLFEQLAELTAILESIPAAAFKDDDSEIWVP